MFIDVIQRSCAAIPAGEDANPLLAIADIDQPQPSRRPPLPRPMALQDASRALPISDAVRDAMQPADPQGALGKCIPTH